MILCMFVNKIHYESEETKMKKTNEKVNGNATANMMISGGINVSISGTYTETHEFIRRDGTIGRETDTRTADNLNLNIGLDNVKVEAGLEGILGLIKDSTGFDTIPKKKIVEDNISDDKESLKAVLIRMADMIDPLMRFGKEAELTSDVIPKLRQFIESVKADHVLDQRIIATLYRIIENAEDMRGNGKISTEVGRYLMKELLLIALENY